MKDLEQVFYKALSEDHGVRGKNGSPEEETAIEKTGSTQERDNYASKEVSSSGGGKSR